MLRATLAMTIIVAVMLAALGMPGGTARAQSSDPGTIGCPDGFVPRPPNLNPALGPCIPGSIASNEVILAVLAIPPVGCPPGFVPRPPELNPALGRCIPGSIAADPGSVVYYQLLINPTPLNCPRGWVQRPPELNPALGPCVPGTIVSEAPEPQ